MVVGPGIARNSRPARTIIVVCSLLVRRPYWHGLGGNQSALLGGIYAARGIDGRGMETRLIVSLVSRQPAASASSTEQNQRVPLLICILICAYQRLVGV